MSERPGHQDWVAPGIYKSFTIHVEGELFPPLYRQCKVHMQ